MKVKSFGYDQRLGIILFRQDLYQFLKFSWRWLLRGQQITKQIVGFASHYR